MHGRLKVKTSKEQDEERKVKEREKAYRYRQLTDRLFEIRSAIKSAEDLDEYLKLTSELLLINPDFYTIWNIRREALLECVERNPDSIESIWRNEERFTRDCLKKNEKSYNVWQQRIWVLSRMPQSGYDRELLLCNEFLNHDKRNFHCWDYRSYISDLAKTDIESELEFTTKQIEADFSNFSAWHRRHKLLLKGLSMGDEACPKSCNLKLIWKKEYNMVLNALFTDPADQSPWLYHDWLLKNNFSQFSGSDLANLKTLEEMEPDNRWVKQALDLAEQLNR